MFELFVHVELFQGHRKCQDREQRINKNDQGKNGGGKKWTNLKNIQAVLLREKVTMEKMKNERRNIKMISTNVVAS